MVLETFILFEDKVGAALQEALLDAAGRGVDVHVLVDGYGSYELSRGFIAKLIQAGVKFRVFDPGQKVMGKRINVLRRMHRKIVVVDGELAFIGGINYGADHLADFGPTAKQDYATAIRGPVVQRSVNSCSARSANRRGKTTATWAATPNPQATSRPCS